MTEAVKTRRARRSESEWRSLVARHPASGLGIKSFCRSEQICEASFYRWRTILNGNQEVSSGVRRNTGAAFVDLGALESAAKPKLDLRLELGDGLILHLVRH